MTLVLRKLLASSTFAIAGALDTMAKRLQAKLQQHEPAELARRGTRPRTTRRSTRPPRNGPRTTPRRARCPRRDRAAIEREIADLEAFATLADFDHHNAKGEALLKALDVAFAKAAELGRRAEGDHLHRVAPHPGLSAARAGRQPLCGEGIVLFNGTNTDDALPARSTPPGSSAHKGTDRVTGSRTADMRSALVDYFRDEGPHHDRDRGGGRGHQPAVLLAGGELRPALEPAAHRAAHRPLPPLRPEARCGRGQLPQPEERRRPARVRAALARSSSSSTACSARATRCWARSSPASTSRSGSRRSTSTAASRTRSKRRSTQLAARTEHSRSTRR